MKNTIALTKRKAAVVSVFLVLLMVAVFASAQPASATSKTADEAIKWAQQQVGKSIDADGYYGVQCVDLITAYNKFLGDKIIIGNGNQFDTAAIPTGWSRVKGGTPSKGDILVYTGGDSGHVAIFESTNVSYHQKYNGILKVQKVSGNYKTVASGYWGYIRPNFKKPGPVLSGKKAVNVTPGYYMLQFDNTRYIDIASNSNKNGTNIHIYDPHDSGAQVFQIGKYSNNSYWIKNVNSGKVVDTSGDLAGHRNVQQWQMSSNGKYNKGQRWIFEDAGNGQYFIRNEHKYYLDVSGGVNANSRNVGVYSFNGAKSQKWKLVRLSGKPVKVNPGNYIIQYAAGNRFLNVDGAKNGNMANVNILWPSGGKEQIFNISRNNYLGRKWSNGYEIKALHSNKMLDTAGNVTGAKINVQQWQHGSSSTYLNNGQHWAFEDAGNGRYYIRNLYGYYLDVAGGVNKDYQNVWTYQYNGNGSQKWRIIPVSGNANKKDVDLSKEYYIQSKIENKVLHDENGNLVIKTNNGSDKQTFTAVKIFAGYGFIGKSSGKYVDTDKEQARGNVGTFNGYTGKKTQNWFVEDAGGGYFYIRNFWGYYLDVSGGKNAEGQNVQAWTFNATDSQKWKFVQRKKSDQNTAVKSDDAKDEKMITTQKSDKDFKGATFSKLRARETKVKKNAVTLKWVKIPNASKYVIYGNKCGAQNKMKKLVTLNGDENSWTNKKLAKATYYKYVVVAYSKLGNDVKTVAISRTVHAATKGGKVTNCKAISKVPTKTKLRKGSNLKLRPAQTKEVKRGIIKKHRAIGYESSNTKICTVNEKGKITAKQVGKCSIFVYGQNGSFKIYKVNVIK